MDDVTVVLNGFNRPHCLKLQLEALEKSTIKPAITMLWYNYPSKPVEIDRSVLENTHHIISNTNWGVWARFFFALNAPTRWICVLDDDTIPGTRWLENCLRTQETHPGLLGTVGLTFPAGTNNYSNYTRTGWADSNNLSTVEVDFCGHSWFFDKAWLEYFVRELPKFPDSCLCGEDMHFSYVLRKYAGINTYVPPHDPMNKEMWGSVAGWVHGTQEALCDSGGQWDRMNGFFTDLRNRGWKLVSEK